RNDGDGIRVAQELNVRQCFGRGFPVAIHLGQRVTKQRSVGRVVCEHTFTTAGEIVVMFDCFRIEIPQRSWIAEIVEEKTALLGNLIERNSLDPKSGFSGRTMTSRFGSA